MVVLGLIIPRRKHLRIGERERRGVLPIGRGPILSFSSLRCGRAQ